MAVRPEQLALLVEGRTGTRSPPVAYPGPAGVLYAPPNADGSRKSCANCCLWAEKDGECLVHPRGLKVSADAVCGYHVFGEPQLFASAIVRPEGIDPKLSGLEEVPGGTSCDLCKYFDDRGLCRAVSDPKTGAPPAKVEPLGCCARWERADDGAV